MKERGFTIVELLVVIIVMAILLTLAVVNVRSTQANARDDERIVDVENVSLALESFYASNHGGVFRKSYPGTLEFNGDLVMNFIKERTGESSLRAPGVDSGSPISFVIATNNSTPTTGLSPMPTITTYVYQPLTSNGTLCPISDGPCQRFNIYYRLEKATDDCPAPENICTYKSKNQ